jgi:hypothetical protein
VAARNSSEPSVKMDEDSTDYQSKWRRLGDLALAYGDALAADVRRWLGDREA